MLKHSCILTIAIFLASPCSACLWDYDTLAMERAQFPTAHELIVGKFVRHSPAYYQWRISDRKAKGTDAQTAADFDDIAVAHDKLGQHESAIQTMKARMERWPNERQYEAQANMGTFHIHAGRFEEGLVHISKAIEINPDAHFGREVYQKHLVEYLIQRKANGQTEQSDEFDASNFCEYLRAKRQANQPEETVYWEDESAKAVKGVLGMMRFGNYDSPVLLEALGDLLAGPHSSDSKMLAARAYLRAAEFKDAERLREKAKDVLDMQVNVGVADIESDLKREVEEGDQFFDRIVRDETKWVATGKNLDKEFAKKYYKAKPQVRVGLSDRFGIRDRLLFALAISVIGGLLALFLVAKVVKRLFQPPASEF